MKYFRISIMSLFIYMFTTALLLASHKPANILSRLIAEADQNNTQIKAVYDRLLAEQNMIPQAQSLPDPNINLGYIKMDENKMMDVDPRQEQMIGISQMIPFPGKLYVRGKIATLDAQRIEAEYLATRLAVIAQLKRMYYELYFINKSIEIFKENYLLLEKIEKSTESNYSVGKVPQQDIFRAQTEVSRLEMRLVMLRQEGTSMQADINRLLNRPLDIEIITPSKLSITPISSDLARLNYLVEHQAPLLSMQQRNVEKGSQKIQLSKMDYFPDLEIGISKLRDTKMNTNGYQVMVSASIPLYFMSKQNNSVRESVARYSADKNDLATTYRNLLFQVKNAFLQAQRSAQLIELIQQTIIPQASLTFSSSQASYGVGKIDFLTLLNNLLMLQDNKLELEKEIVQHEKAITQLEEITGIYL